MEFQLITNIPLHGFFFPGMFVTGKLVIVNDIPKDYRAIQVRLVGFADVHWSERTGSGDNRRTRYYRAHENYIDLTLRVWDKDTLAGGGLFPTGSFEYPFSFQLVGENLPPTFDSTDGKIRYAIESQIVKNDQLKVDTVNEAPIKVLNVVEAYLPNLLQPMIMEAQKTAGFLCFVSGPITFRVSTPRTGYRIQRDSIPVEVSVENGSSKNVTTIGAYILKVVQYRAQKNRYDRRTVAGIVGPGVPAHRTIQWNPPPLKVPDTTATLLNCGIISVTYFLRVGANIPWSVSPTVDIPIVLGTPSLPEVGVGPQPELAPYPQLGFIPQSGAVPDPIPPQPYPPSKDPDQFDPPSATIAQLDSLPPRYDDVS